MRTVVLFGKFLQNGINSLQGLGQLHREHLAIGIM